MKIRQLFVISIVVFAICSLLFVVHRCSSWVKEDSCFDSGGVWGKEEGICLHDQQAIDRYLARHPRNLK